MFIATRATKKIKALDKRIRGIQGGTSASKTVSILLILIDLAQCDTEPTVTSIVSESFPHLRRGVIRDFLNIMETHRYFDPDRWDKTNSTYTFETGSIIEFFSIDQSDKLRGGRRHRGFMNEANKIPREAFDQFEVRTRDLIFLDWNPSEEFWFYDLKGERNDVDHITVTYKDNEALDAKIVAAIEQRRANKRWFRVYGEGQLGEIEGRIYKGWKEIEEIPHEARLISYGLDFGYTNDPSSIVAIYYYNGGYVIDEIAFTKGLSNRQIADILLTFPPAPIYADSAEPKSIDEIRLYGLTILPSTKGKGSVSQGIQFVQAQAISVTKHSVNVIREYKNYLWEMDNNGKILNTPEHQWSHSMDAVRYGFQIKANLKEEKPYKQAPYESPQLYDYSKLPMNELRQERAESSDGMRSILGELP